ncbi:MAG: GspE/PulE family protein [Planctomycetota bacterium]
MHLDPDRESLVARLRVDGVLEHYRRLPIALHPEVVSRFKVQAGMDIAERRAPQDGRFTWQPAHGPAAGQRVDVRVASMPTVHGERLTLRLLALQGDALTLERLGMRAEHLDLFSRCLRLPWGLALITGPTGSGKTTTLYAGLRQLIGERHLNVITVEDPIESDVPGIAQVEVDSADKVSFGKALRSVLRHDPDVVMVGEVRDRETADIVIKSALTGHLVLSTLHTNSATGAVTRLVDMGVEPYLVAATLRLAVAQRLARKLCSRCACARPLTLEDATGLGSPPQAGASAHAAHGCVYCAGRGYIGRVGLFEMLPVTADWSREIAEGASEGAIREQAMARGMSVLADDAIRKVCDGTISPRDALAAVAGW